MNNLKYIFYGAVTTFFAFVILWLITNTFLSIPNQLKIGQVWVSDPNKDYPPNTVEHVLNYKKIVKMVTKTGVDICISTDNLDFIGYYENSDTINIKWSKRTIFIYDSTLKNK
jgi:hypothetical protein